MLLPPELLDYILGYLQSDKATLKACLLSHPTHFQLVERYLYANVTVQDSPNSSNEFCDVLRDHPHVAKYVRAFQVEFGYSEDPDAFLEGISLILPMFSSLRKIELLCRIPLHQFRCQIGKFHLALLECLRLPSMTDIHIDSFHVPLSTLSHCKHIRSLTLEGCWHVEGDVADDGFPTVDSLSFRGCIRESLFSTISLTRLCHPSSIEFYENDWDFLEFVPKIGTVCSHSLTSLVVDIGQSCDLDGRRYDFNMSNLDIVRSDKAISVPVPPSLLPNLQDLALHAQLKCVPKQYCFTLPGLYSPILAITEALKTPSSLKRLTLDFCFSLTFHAYEEFRDPVTHILCTSLHSLLLQSTSTLVSTNLRVKSIRNQRSGYVSPDTILSMFAGHSGLMEFVERGALIFTSVVAEDQ